MRPDPTDASEHSQNVFDIGTEWTRKIFKFRIPKKVHVLPQTQNWLILKHQITKVLKGCLM